MDTELSDLPADMLARFRYIAGLIEEFGLGQVREPHVKHVRDALWEMRMSGKAEYRVRFTSPLLVDVVVVRVFSKKTNKTPSCEIALALTRAKEILK